MTHASRSRSTWIGLLAVALAFLVGTAASAEGVVVPPAPALRLVQMGHGLRSIAPERDLDRIEETNEFELAQKVGVDLRAPNHDAFVHRFDGERLFYLFFKTVDDAYGPRQYLIQRIKKTVREWTEGSDEPEETVTYLVEVFKPHAGMLKRADRHVGYFALRDKVRREIVKECEIGYGTLPGHAEGLSWPFDAGRLYVRLYGYGPDATLHDQVRLESATRWTLDVSFAKDGTYAIRSPELGIDAPTQLPDHATGTPRPDPDSEHLVLTEGAGVAGLALGDPAASIDEVLGEPVCIVRYPSGRAAHRTDAHLTVKVDDAGVVRHIYTHSAFGGRTTKGIRHGAHRGEVMRAYGPPPDDRVGSASWRYAGVRFDFDSFERVRRIVISR